MLQILIVDDEEIERKALGCCIKESQLGIGEVIEAENGRKAIMMARLYRPELIVMDIKMPGINGLEATEAIREFLPEAQVIILTAFDQFEYAKEAIKLSVVDYLLKPVNEAQLKTLLEQQIKKVLAQREKEAAYVIQEQQTKLMKSYLEKEYIHGLLGGQIEKERLEDYFRYLDLKVKGFHCVLIKLEKGLSEFQQEMLLERIGKVSKEVGFYPLFHSNERKIRGVCFSLENQFFTDKSEATLSKIMEQALHFRSAKGDVMISEETYQTDLIPSIFATLGCVQKQKEITEHQMGCGRRVVNILCDYINEHYKEEIHLDRLATEVGFSKFYLGRIFKQEQGMTPIEYLQVRRITLAKSHLVKSHKSIKEISYDVGYKDANYFATAFKKVTGVSPSRFREQYFKDNNSKIV